MRSGAYEGDDTFGEGTERAHRLQGTGAGLGRRAPPPGVDRGQHPRLGVEERHGHAVSDEDGQCRMEVGRDENVGRRNGVVHLSRSPAALDRSHNGGDRTVDLLGEDHGVEIDAEGPGSALPDW